MIHVPTAWWNWDYDHMPAVYADPDEEPDEMPPIVKTGDQEAFTRQAQHIREKYGVYISCLIFGTPDEVAAETQRVIDLMSAGGGYITCSSQEIQTDVPYENLKALIDTARANG